MTFQIHGLAKQEFEGLASLSIQELAERGIITRIADSGEGYPCRVSMKEASEGEKLFLFSYDHLTENSPYKASHAIYVRENAEECEIKPNEIPSILSSRLMSVRGYDTDHLMRFAEVVDGTDLKSCLEQAFALPNIDYVHLHNAKAGCFAAKVTRAG